MKKNRTNPILYDTGGNAIMRLVDGKWVALGLVSATHEFGGDGGEIIVTVKPKSRPAPGRISAAMMYAAGVSERPQVSKWGAWEPGCFGGGFTSSGWFGRVNFTGEIRTGHVPHDEFVVPKGTEHHRWRPFGTMKNKERVVELRIKDPMLIGQFEATMARVLNAVMGCRKQGHRPPG